MAKLVCTFGHSHIHALWEAYQSQLRSGMACSAVEFRFALIPIVQQVFTTEGGKLGLGQEILNAVRSKFDENSQPTYVSLVGGNAHNTIGLMENPVPFDFFLPENPSFDVDRAVEILPYEFIVGCMEKLLFTHVNMLRCFRGYFSGPMMHIESPPPIEDNDYILSNLDRFFQDKFPNGKVASPKLRYKLWRVHSSIIERVCREEGILFVGAPKEAKSENGFLLREYYTDNATHANAKYGVLILQQIAAKLDM